MKNLHTSKQAYLGEWKRCLEPNLHIAKVTRNILIVRGWHHDLFFFFLNILLDIKTKTRWEQSLKPWSLNLNFNLWKCTY